MALRDDCIDVLKKNDRGRHTVPSPNLYPHQWAWDSAFAAIGWAYIEHDRAVAELECLLDGAWADGRVPHIQFDPNATGYWPGPDFWGTERSSSITQPPVWASAARRMIEIGVAKEKIAPLLPKMEASHRFFRAQRDPDDRHLVSVVHPWESGRDNCPAWDAPLGTVDPADAPAFERRDTQHVDDPAERPTDDTYRRYAVLVKAIEASEFGPGPFDVYDPMLSALLVKADEDLAALAEACGFADSDAATRAERGRAGLLEHLWDARRGRFAFVDAVQAHAYFPNVLAAYVPLILDLPDEVAAEAKRGLETFFDTPFPLPTTAPADPAFEPRRYWRGPTWINLNWLFVPVLGEDLRRQTIELVTRSGFREYFDPTNGDGLGADQFAWTAALTLDLLER